MAKKKTSKKELKEISREEINGSTVIKYEDGSMTILTSVHFTAEELDKLFPDDDSDEDDEDDSDDEEDGKDDEDDSDDSDEDSDDDSDEDSDEDDEDEDDDEMCEEVDQHATEK